MQQPLTSPMKMFPADPSIGLGQRIDDTVQFRFCWDGKRTALGTFDVSSDFSAEEWDSLNEDARVQYLNSQLLVKMVQQRSECSWAPIQPE